MGYYYAYGSNMNQQRMIDRGIKFTEVIPAKLEDYELRFNKISKKQGAVANVVPKKGSVVEGVLYKVEDISIMDRFEGAPKHYRRIILNVSGIDAWVYVANQEYIREGLKPKQEYLNHLLAGKEFLSDDYYKKLESNGI